MASLKDYIMVVDILSPNLCEDILAEYASCDNWVDAVVGGGATVEKNIRNCQTIGISQPTIITKNPEIRGNIDRWLFQAAGKAIQSYRAKFPDCMIQEDTGYELLRYTKGGFYHQHCDSFLQQPRAVSCSFLLNDDFKGGKWGFFDGRYKLAPPKGSVVMFPSNFMFPHEIMEVTKGTRYSIITWFR